MHHIASWLVELPVFEVVEAFVVDTTLAPSFGSMPLVYTAYEMGLTALAIDYELMRI